MKSAQQGEAPYRRPKHRSAVLCRAAIVLLGLGQAAGGHALTQEEHWARIDEGFRLFTEETFDGNGRTCATCHIPERSYTISPRDLAELSPEQLDLVFARNVPGLENEALVQQLTLFNVGPNATRGPFRSSMAISGLALTLGNSQTRLGWAGDGSPIDPDIPGADGTLRAFSIGAVQQHFTLRENRLEGIDFRLPTDFELDALSAFMLSLGRQFELDLGQLVFSDERAEAGRMLFLDTTPAGARCNACHRNGGGTTADGENSNFDTGINRLTRSLGNVAGVPIPRDPGFEGSGTFNVPSVIEAARKAAFFHNSAFTTDVEGAIRFYFTNTFNTSPGSGFSGKINFNAIGNTTGQNNLNLFVRALSAYYSMLDCERMLDDARQRLAAGVDYEVPLLHARLALEQVFDILFQAPTPANQRLFRSAMDRAFALAPSVATVPMAEDPAAALEDLLAEVRSLRLGMATTPELP